METHPQLKQVQSVVYQESDVQTSLINSKGIDLSQRSTYAYAYAVGVFHEDDDIQSAMEITLAKTFEELDAKAIASETIDKGVKKLGGTSLASKRYPVVFENKTFGSILGAFGSNFSAESAYRNLSPLKDKVGTSIAKSFVQLIDDPLTKEAFQQMAFDHEGVACRTKNIIKDGVFQGFLHNLKTASIFQQEPTGNSFGGGISATNLVMKPGSKSFDELLAPIQDGVYINNLMGLHAGVKTSSGDFSIQASGFKIEQGQLTRPVKMIVVSGNFFTMMNEIEGLDNELAFNLSSIAAPNVYIKELGIAGE
jgi:PmbA protein